MDVIIFKEEILWVSWNVLECLIWRREDFSGFYLIFFFEYLKGCIVEERLDVVGLGLVSVKEWNF